VSSGSDHSFSSLARASTWRGGDGGRAVAESGARAAVAGAAFDAAADIAALTHVAED